MKIVFAGTPDFAAGHLEALLSSHHQIVAVITQPDKPGKRGRNPVAGPVKQRAKRANLQCLQPNKLGIDDLNDLDFDVLVVVAYGQILKPDVLQYPRYGCINVHASILPRWRGAAPVQRAILAGDQETGVTIIQMDAGLDTGDMLAKEAIAIESTDTAGSLLGKMLNTGGQLLIDTLDALEANTTTPEQQNNDETCYAAKIVKEDALIKWQDTADEIDRRVRAFQPEPVAYCFLGDKRIRIHSGTYNPDTEGNPGEILEINKKGLIVACGSGAYQITAIQLPIGKGAILKPADVMNGWTELLHPGVLLKSSPE